MYTEGAEEYRAHSENLWSLGIQSLLCYLLHVLSESQLVRGNQICPRDFGCQSKAKTNAVG